MSQSTRNWFPKWNGKQPSLEFIRLLDVFLYKGFYSRFGEPQNWDLIYSYVWPIEAESIEPAPGENKECVNLFALKMRLGKVYFRAIISWFSLEKPRFYQIDETDFPPDFKIILYDTVFYDEDYETGESFDYNAYVFPERMIVKKVDYGVSYPLLFQGEFNPEKSEHIFIFFILNKKYQINTVKNELIKASELSAKNPQFTKNLKYIFKHVSLEFEGLTNAYWFGISLTGFVDLSKFIKALDQIDLSFHSTLFTEFTYFPTSARLLKGKSLYNIKASERYEWLAYIISAFSFGLNFSEVMDRQLREQLIELSGGNITFDNNLTFGIGIEKSDFKKTIDEYERKVCTIKHKLSIGYGYPSMDFEFKWYSESADDFIDGKSEEIPKDLTFIITRIADYTEFNEEVHKLFEKEPLLEWTLNTYFTIYREMYLDGSSGIIKLVMKTKSDPEEISEIFSDIVYDWNKKMEDYGGPFFRYIMFDRKEDNALFFTYDAGVAIGSHKFIMEELSKRIDSIVEVFLLN